jgi:hypothetical protein
MTNLVDQEAFQNDQHNEWYVLYVIEDWDKILGRV